MAREKVDKDGLTEQERRFADEYRKERNATQTYLKIYSTSKKPVTYKTAKCNSHRLLKRTKVAEYIKRLDARASSVAKATAKEIIEGLARGAFWGAAEAKALVNKDGTYKSMEAINDDVFPAINGFHKGRPVLMDRVKCLELLGKYRKLFTDKHELAGADGLPLDSNREIKVELTVIKPKE